MAASTVEESPVQFSPDEVGKAFADQYYKLLEYNPSPAYQFYEERSKLGRSENGGSMSLTTTMEAINEKIQSYGSLKAEIKSVDAQWSYNGVIVLITGYMINPDISRRAFTQTFFLAPQEKGYFVLNDIFRYVEDDHISQHGDRIAPSTPSEEGALPVQKKHSYEQSNEKAVNPSENGEVLVKGGKEEKEEEPVAVVVDEAPNESEVVVDEAPNQLEVVVDEAPNQSEVVVDEAPNQSEVVVDEAPNQSEVVVDEAPNQSEVVIESNYKVEEAPKKSYASIVFEVINRPKTFCVKARARFLHLYFCHLPSTWSVKRKNGLTPRQLTSAFTPDGMLHDRVNILEIIRSGGIDPSIRAEVWPFLLGVYDLNSSKEVRDVVWNKNREKYQKFQKNDPDVTSEKATEDFATWQRIIRQDAIRANAEWIPHSPSLAVVSDDKARCSAEAVGLKDYDNLEPCRIYHASRLVAILEAYTIYDPEIGYCQGMSDLLSPIISVIEEDHTAFWCFVGFMKKARHNFRLDEVGIRRQLNTVAKIIKYKDPQLYEHLVQLDAHDFFFVYRMVVVLFRRELSFEQILWLWEVMWADQATLRAGFFGKSEGRTIIQRVPPTEDLLLYAIAASVLQRKLIIEKYNSRDEILSECNNMSGQLDVWKLLDDAHYLVMTLHDKVDSHYLVVDEAPNQLEVVVDEAPNQSEVVVDEAPNQYFFQSKFLS